MTLKDFLHVDVLKPTGRDGSHHEYGGGGCCAGREFNVSKSRVEVSLQKMHCHVRGRDGVFGPVGTARFLININIGPPEFVCCDAPSHLLIIYSGYVNLFFVRCRRSLRRNNLQSGLEANQEQVHIIISVAQAKV